MSVPGLKQAIRREIQARTETLVGTVVSNQALIAYDASVSGGETWVVDVDIGSNRILKDVPIKAGTRGRFFAQLGQSVALRRNLLGRFDIVGPADRVRSGGVLTTYNPNAGAAGAAAQTGFQAVLRPLEWYQGAQAMRGAPALTFAAAGNTITRLDAGSFIADGLLAGQVLRVAGSASNNGTKTPTIVAASVLTFASGIVNESAAAGRVSIARDGTSRWADGVSGFPHIDVINLATGLPV